MSNVKKDAGSARRDAGQARQRPRPPAQRPAETAGATPTPRPAGNAPAYDSATRQLVAPGSAPRGMISNPWVKQWSGQTPQASPQAAVPRADTAPKKKTRRAPSDAGSAPKPARDNT
jgi:hypothetical protein